MKKKILEDSLPDARPEPPKFPRGFAKIPKNQKGFFIAKTQRVTAWKELGVF